MSKHTPIQPVGSILRTALRAEKHSPWCREVLLYSPDNKCDFPDHRTFIFTADAVAALRASHDELVAALRELAAVTVDTNSVRRVREIASAALARVDTA